MLLSALIISTGCASKQLTQDESFDQSALEKASEFSGDSERALIEAEVKYEAAISSNMNFYAPLHMKQASEKLAKAREAELKGLLSDSLIASAKVITLLQLAEDNKKKVEVLLKPIFVQKKALEELNTSKVLPNQYNDRLEDIKELVAKIEQDKESITPNEINSILVDLQQLEVDTLLEIHWQPAKDTLEKAEDEDADTNAPTSFEIAEELVEQAEKDIRAEYSNRALVKEKGLAALRSSQHALYVARDAEQLLKLNNKRAEEAVLKFEALLAQIGNTLKAKDLRHMALQDQATALAQNAETQASRLIAPLQNRITELEKKIERFGQVKTLEVVENPEAIETPSEEK
jgi:hypothetical protein